MQRNWKTGMGYGLSSNGVGHALWPVSSIRAIELLHLGSDVVSRLTQTMKNQDKLQPREPF
jgi:hypothetical protein